jgi:hypothetical protein
MRLVSHETSAAIPLTTRMSGKGAAPECHVSPRVPSLSALSSQLPRSVPLSIETSVFDAARACHPSLTPGAEIHAGRVKRRRVESADQPANVTKDPEPLSPRTRSRHPKVTPTCGSHGGSMNWTCTDRPLRGVARGWQEINQPGTKTKLVLTWAFSARREGFEPPTARSVGGCSPSIR